MFPYLSETEIIILVALNFLSANAFSLVEVKILSSGRGLNQPWVDWLINWIEFNAIYNVISRISQQPVYLFMLP